MYLAQQVSTVVMYDLHIYVWESRLLRVKTVIVYAGIHDRPRYITREKRDGGTNIFQRNKQD